MSARFIEQLLAPLPEGEGFDAQAFLDQCARDEGVTFTARTQRMIGWNFAQRYLAGKGGAA